MRDPQCNVFGERLFGRIELPNRGTWFYVSEPVSISDEESQRRRVKDTLLAFRDSGEKYPKNEDGFNKWKIDNPSILDVGRPPVGLVSRDAIARMAELDRKYGMCG